MKLVAMLRVKDQILIIRECLTKLSELVDEIIIVDNGSTDGTFDVYKEFPKIVTIEKTQGFDEGRDKCFVLELARKREPDWILWIDADEVFERSTTRDQLEAYTKIKNLDVVQFRLFHFWLSKDFYRVDGIWKKYTAVPQRQMWRNKPEAYFRNIPFHNGGIMGLSGKQIVSPIRILHYGYIDEKVNKKRNLTYSDLSNDPMAKKTPSYSIVGMKRWRWWESENKILNSCIQYGTKIYWDGVQFYQTLIHSFGTKSASGKI